MGTCQYYFVTSKTVSSTQSPFNVKLTNFKRNPSSKVSYVERVIFEFSSKDRNNQYLIEIWDYKGKVKTKESRNTTAKTLIFNFEKDQ